MWDGQLPACRVNNQNNKIVPHVEDYSPVDGATSGVTTIYNLPHALAHGPLFPSSVSRRWPQSAGKLNGRTRPSSQIQELTARTRSSDSTIDNSTIRIC